MQTRLIPADQPEAIPAAIQALKRGELVAFPTDTVYGVGALVHDPEGIAQLYQVKERGAEKAIPVLLGDPGDLALVALEVGPVALRLAGRFWPGALTLVVPRHPALPEIISPYPTIGVRMPDHPVALRLLRAAGPLAATSANLSGAQSATTAEEVMSQLAGRIALILDGGRAPGGQPSTVVDCTGPDPEILRPGPVTLEQILAVL